MRKDVSICVGIHIENQIIDLQIPLRVSVSRLKELLRESLQLIQITLPTEFELEVINKPIKLKENVILSNYGLGTGDQFKLNPTSKK